jgi:hypothetical protein
MAGKGSWIDAFPMVRYTKNKVILPHDSFANYFTLTFKYEYEIVIRTHGRIMSAKITNNAIKHHHLLL